MEIVNIHQAKTHLSRLLERVVGGEEIVIAKNGRPIVKVVPIGDQPRKPGRLKGHIEVSSNLEDPLPEEVIAAFQGDSA